MKAAIYNPYLDTLGGGERYTMAFAEELVKAGYTVDLEWSNNTINPTKFWQPRLKKLGQNPSNIRLTNFNKKFGIKLKNLNFVEDINRGDGYDLLFWVSDGSIPLLKARKNYLHFQIPFTGVKRNAILDRMKFFRINGVICNTEFTKKFVDKEYGVESKVLYPPVDVASIKPRKKENIILAVGRFSQLTQAKNQHILIDVFKGMLEKGLKDWKLIIAGGTEVGADNYLLKIKKRAEGFPIEILESPDFKTIKDLLGKAKLFWSAAGFGIDEEKMPHKVEHFGIAVVEAMSAGAVPLAVNAGGHKETIDNGKNGFLWNKKSELAKKTLDLTENKKLLRELSQSAHKTSLKFSYDAFRKRVEEILK